MKKHIFLMVCMGMLAVVVSAQSTVTSAYLPKGKKNRASLTVAVPAARFADSHMAGAGLSYTWSHYRFGDSVNARKLIGFTAQVGVDYFFGKRVTSAGYPFRYGNNLYVQVMPGVICNPSAKSHVMLLGGPSLGIYKDASSLSYAVSLSGAYQVSSKISVGPAVVFRKHAEVDALWTGGVSVGWVF